MTQKLRVGIAGYGVVGKRRRLHIDSHPDLKTIAVSDIHLVDSVMDDGVKTFDSYKKLLNEKLDVLFVCLPNDVAPDATLMGLSRGMHVFCEKPPGRSIQDIADVIRVEKKHPSLKLKYGFNHRYHDSVRDALKIIESKELGDLVNLRGVYGKSQIISFASDWRTKRSQAGGGILLDQGIHMIDLMRLFAGEFSQIHSFVSNSYWNHDVEDNAYALMRTDSGVVAMMHSSATQWRHSFRLEISLQKGLIILSGILSGSKSYGAETITVAYKSQDDLGDPLEKTTRYNQDNSWRDEIYEFANALQNDGKILHGSSIDALQTMLLVHRIYLADSGWKAKFRIEEIPEDILGLLKA